MTDKHLIDSGQFNFIGNESELCSFPAIDQIMAFFSLDHLGAQSAVVCRHRRATAKYGNAKLHPED